jgi:DNA-binding transcriptional MocR family regulator
MSKTIWQPRLRKDAAPLYRAIADAIERDVESGVLRGGSRLPTHRSLASTLRVTTLTVTRAYAEAARRGLLESTVGRGTFVRDASLRAEDRRAVDLSRNIIRGGEDLELGRDLLPELRRIVRSSEYQTPPGGSERHRAAAAAWIGRVGLEVPADRPLLVPGAQHALHVLLLTLLDRRSALLCEPLMYPALKPLLSLLRIDVTTVGMDDEGIDPKALDRACRETNARALYCVPTFQNPTGAVMSDERRRSIAAVASRHELTIIEDDVYGFLPTTPLRPLASYLPEQTCYVTTTSKSISPSLRVGFIAAPPSLHARIESAIYATVSFTSTLSCETFTSLVESGEADRAVAQKRQLIRDHNRVARKTLGDQLDTGHELAPHLWLPLPDSWDATDFVQECSARGVVLAPPGAFALDRRHLRNAVRISLGAAANAAELRDALSIVSDVLAAERMTVPAMV